MKDAQGAEIKWIGILTDWEMSKPIDGSKLAPGGRQPERTVSGSESQEPHVS